MSKKFIISLGREREESKFEHKGQIQFRSNLQGH